MMDRIPHSKDAGGEDGEGEESVQGVETQILLLPGIDGLASGDLWVRKGNGFILRKISWSSKPPLADLPQGERLTS